MVTVVNQNLIGGRWTDTRTATENRSPSDPNDLVGLYAQGDAYDVEEAVCAASRAQSEWRAIGSQARSDLLDRVGVTLWERRQDLGRLLSREEGKTLVEGVGEVARAAQIFRFFAGQALRLTGETIESVRGGVDVEIWREPVGVVGLITPWNFPIAIPAWKIAPALAFGNTVIIKPADLTPASVHALAKIMVECGCPPGVFNLVMGPGSVVGQALVKHPQVDAISFTGSATTGRSLIAHAAANQKKVQAEMGSKNPMVILEDADLAVAIPACINAAFGSTGQRCTAASRFIVERGILAKFSEAIADAAAALQVGHALDPATQIGPVASQTQLGSNLAYVALARAEGARVVGGELVQRTTAGSFQRPALFFDADNSMRISRDEIFGPCACVIEARDFEHALELANDTSFGLSAGICTRSLKHAREFRRRAAAGMVMINLPTAGVDYHVPFGGVKASSYGPREQGSHAEEFYTTVKTAYTFAP